MTTPGETATQTTTVEKAPEECAQALDLAGEGFGLAGEVFEAIGNLDITPMTRESEEFAEWSNENSDRLALVTAVCRAAAADY